MLLVGLPACAANLLPNSSFELGSHKGWSALGTKDLAVPFASYYSTEQAQHGTHSIKLEYKVGTGVPNSWASVPVVLQPNTAYRLSGYFRETSAGSYGPTFRIVNTRTKASLATLNINPDTTWGRADIGYTNGASPVSVRVEVRCPSSYDGVWLYVDALQLEVGNSATTYAPPPQELGFTFSADATGNVFRDNQTPSVPLYLWNTAGSNVTRTVDWELRDFWGAVRLSGANTLTLPEGLTSTNIDCTLSSNHFGHFRLLAHLRDIADTRDEIALSVVPVRRTLSASTNGLFGVHVRGAAHFLNMWTNAGGTWARSLSVAPYGEWNKIEPTDDAFAFGYDAELARYAEYGVNLIVPIGQGFKDPVYTPSFATNGSGDVVLAEYLELVTNVVSHYVPLGVKHFEIGNEPFNDNDVSYTTYASMVSNAAIYIRSQGGKVLAPVSYYTNHNWASLGNATSNSFDIYVTHIYPGNTLGGNDEMAGTFGKPGINGEHGSTTLTAYRTLRWEDIVGEYDPFAATVPSASGTFDNQRNPSYGNLGFVKVWAYASGANIRQSIYYDGRTIGAADQIIAYSLWDWDQSPKPMLATVAAAAKFADETGIKGGTLVSGSARVEVFQVDGTNSLALAWSEHITNLYTLTTTLGDFDVYDVMGNPMPYGSGIEFSAVRPAYMFATGTATNTLLSSLSIAAASDTTAPTVEVASFPIGTQSGSDAFEFRWWPTDNVGVSRFQSISNSILSSWKLVGVDSDFTSYAATNKARYASVPASGEFVVRVQDPAGNVTTESVTWPYSAPAVPTYKRTRFRKI
jgi:hypothetical protein